jgi:H+/Cl- antiporter ClcA
MVRGDVEAASTTNGLPVSPSLGPALAQAGVPARATAIDQRVLWICVLSTFLGALAGLIAELLIHLIWLVTNISFYGRFSWGRPLLPITHASWWMIFVPVIGGVIVGLIARYGSAAIRGHGIPEAMEQVLTNQSRVPARMTFLKPLSSAIAIGTGGPFGAEGPIIATGGAVGSLIGQLLKTTASERKTLLSAGAAAGIAAAFGSPVAAVLLAIELLLFEFRPRSIIPVALACAAAAGLHTYFEGAEPVFAFTGPMLHAASEYGLLIYTLLGLIIGVGAVIMTKSVYWIEHHFEHSLHGIHWMWHPAIGAIAVGVIGYFAPNTFGAGYFNLDWLLSDKVILSTTALLCVLKFLSWTIALGSGTAGGTLAPVFTIGGALAAVVAVGLSRLFPGAHLDLRMAALVGMVAIFAGASRALLTSVVFAFETTMQPFSILPALCGCSAAYLISSIMMQHSIMTEKMARQGVHVPAEYLADFLDQVVVRDVCAKNLITLRSDQVLGETRNWINSGVDGSSHQGFAVVDEQGFLCGVVTRRDIFDVSQSQERRIGEVIKRPPIVAYDDSTLREAADHMVNHDVGRLPVVSREKPGKLIGIITRSDLLRAHRRRLDDLHQARQSIRWPALRRNGIKDKHG